MARRSADRDGGQHDQEVSMSDIPRGSGPLAGNEPTGGPIDDPALADRANPRWADPTSPRPDAQPLAEPGSTPNVLPQGPGEEHAPTAAPGPGEKLEDQGARDLEDRAEPGSDNIRMGRGGGTPNPSLAEGGEG
jgi:hypothetical protein